MAHNASTGGGVDGFHARIPLGLPNDTCKDNLFSKRKLRWQVFGPRELARYSKKRHKREVHRAATDASSCGGRVERQTYHFLRYLFQVCWGAEIVAWEVSLVAGLARTFEVQLVVVRKWAPSMLAFRSASSEDCFAHQRELPFETCDSELLPNTGRLCSKRWYKSPGYTLKSG